MRARIAICDDHPAARAALAGMVEADPSLELAAAVGDADGLVGCLALDPADVVVLDLSMPGGDGLGAIEDVLAVAPGTRILIVSTTADPAYARAALCCGASGYLLKDSATTQLTDAIRAVADGSRYVDPVLQHRVPGDTGVDPAMILRRRRLSTLQREILKLLAVGLQTLEIATHLEIPPRLVDVHESLISMKLGAANRLELTAHPEARALLQAAP